jgi:hypothetical protein
VTIVSPRRTVSTTLDPEALFREARRRRRRRRLGWVLLAALLVAAVAATIALAPPGRRQPGTAGHHAKVQEQGAAVAAPAEIVAWTSASNVVVVSTATGHVLRTLATQVSILAPGIPNVSVGPDGTVFFESATPSLVNQGGSGDEMFSVPIAGGPVRDLGAGSDPQVSPDGKFLAFIGPDGAGSAGEAPYLVPPVGIDIATLSSGSIGSVRMLEPGPVQLNQGVSDLSWSSDSQRLSFNLLNTTKDVTTAWTLTPGRSSSLAAAMQIPLGRGLTWNGYSSDAKSGGDVGLGVLHSDSGSDEVVAVNPLTGGAIRRLFRIPGALFPDFSNSVIGNASGTNVLVAGVTPLVDGTPTTSGASYLYRWQEGDHAPTKVAGTVLVASWGPGGRH